MSNYYFYNSFHHNLLLISCNVSTLLLFGLLIKEILKDRTEKEIEKKKYQFAMNK